jgi:hypothetical protein
MKKRQYLTPFAVSVAALLGNTVIPAQASPVPGTPTIEVSAPTATDHLILKRGGSEGQLRLADHESHASHESHSSHVSGG